MGCGKSYWGKQWAKHLQLNFIDLDNRIIEIEKCAVTKIFEKKGEAYFRALEAKTLQSLAVENAVVACGGGTPIFENNMPWMNEKGITIYLEASAAYLLENIKKEPGQRPLIKDSNQAELLFFIQQKIKERETFYKMAKYTLAANQLSVESLQNLLK